MAQRKNKYQIRVWWIGENVATYQSLWFPTQSVFDYMVLALRRAMGHGWDPDDPDSGPLVATIQAVGLGHRTED